MDLSLQIIPVGDTTLREVSVASQQLRSILERLPGVLEAKPQKVAAPEGSKGGVADTLGGLVVSVAPSVLRGLMQALQTVLSRQPATEVMIETNGRKVSLKFDPRKISPQELGELTQRLLADAPPT